MTFTPEARARLDAYLEAIERAQAGLGKTRQERRAVTDDVEGQVMDMLQGRREATLTDVEGVLAKMDRPESFGAARKPEKRKTILRVLLVAFLLAGCGPLAAQIMETMALHIFRTTPMVDAKGLFHDPKEIDPFLMPSHVDVPSGLKPGESWTVTMQPVKPEDLGLRRTWGAYVGWMIAFGIMMPWVVIAAVLAIIGWRRAQFAIEHVMAAMTVLICALVVWHMVVAMGRG